MCTTWYSFFVTLIVSSKYIYFQFHFKIINSISLSILFLSHPSKIGLLLLCATGNLHVSWTIWKLLLYFFDHENTETDILIAWFIGAAGGALLGALLNANWSKILIYVSKSSVTEERTIQKRKNLAAHTQIIDLLTQFLFLPLSISMSNACGARRYSWSYTFTLIHQTTK